MPKATAQVKDKVEEEALSAQVKADVSRRGCSEAVGWEVIGCGYVIADQVEQALYCFAKAVLLEPEEAQHLSNLGFLLVDQQHYKEASEPLELTFKAERPPPPRAQLSISFWHDDS